MKLHPSIKLLVDEIDAFRARNDVHETAFGLDAVKDGKFLSDIRKGRVPSIITIDRVRAYMRRAERVSA